MPAGWAGILRFGSAAPRSPRGRLSSPNRLIEMKSKPHHHAGEERPPIKQKYQKGKEQ